MTPDASDVATEGEPPSGGSDPAPKSESVPPKPLLASEALKDEVAPIEPLKRAARVLAVFAGGLLAATGWLPDWAPLGKPRLELVAGALVALTGLPPMPYTARAGALVLLGVLAGAMGVGGAGPASVVAYAMGEWGVLALLALVALPATLMFRCAYRAFRPARVVLAAGVGLAIPFAVTLGLGFEAADGAVQVASGVALGGFCLGFVGFGSSQVPLSGGALATAVTLAIAAPIAPLAAARLGLERDTEWFSVVASTLAFATATGLAALGSFQLLAARSWQAARDQETAMPPADVPPAAPSGASLTDTWHDRR